MKRLVSAVLLLTTLTACAELQKLEVTSADPKKPLQPMSGEKILDQLDGPKVDSISDSVVTSAEAAFKKGEYAKAAQYYNQLIQQKPKEMRFLLGYADSLRLDGKAVNAREAYEKALEVDPNSIDAFEGKGLSLMEEGKFDAAIGIFNTILSKDASRWRTINAIGVALALTNRGDEAMQYYNAALEFEPNSSIVLNNMGLLQALIGKHEEAIATLNRASQLLRDKDPRKQQVDLNLALVYGISGRMEQAENTARPYLSQAALYNNLGFYAKLSNNQDLAKSYLTKALDTSPVHYEKAWKNMNGEAANAAH